MTPLTCAAKTAHLNDNPQLEEKLQAAANKASTTSEGGSGGKAREAVNNETENDDGSIRDEDLDKWQEKFAKEPARQVLSTLLSQQDPVAKLTTREAAILNAHIFSDKLSVEMKTVTAQENSGRCWAFAVLNMARLAFAKKYNVDDFQFSQSYIHFFDQLHKANVFFEEMLGSLGVPLFMVRGALSRPVYDGGHFQFAINLIERYGLVPQQLCPESYSSSNTSRVTELVNAKLREFALELRAMFETTMPVLTGAGGMNGIEAYHLAVKACRARKQDQMGEIYVILATCLGTPPSPTKRFSYDFYDKDGKHRNLKMTPLEMYADLGEDFQPQNHLTLWNRPDLQPAHRFQLDFVTNVHGGKGLEAVNTTMEVMEDAIVKMIKADLPVYFTCDCRMAGDLSKGIWDTDVADLDGAFGTTFNLNKVQRLQTGQSYPCHAMIITGVHLVDGKPVRYRIENSWSARAGNKGYYVATSGWMHEYLYEVAIHKDLVPSHVAQIFEAPDVTMVEADPRTFTCEHEKMAQCGKAHL